MATRTLGNAPVRKVAAGGLAGAVSTVAVYVLNTYVMPHSPLPPSIAAATTTVLTFLAGYLIPPGATEGPIQA